MTIAATMNGHLMERDDAITLRTSDDLEHAIFRLQFHFSQAQMRGDSLVCEIWTPKVPRIISRPYPSLE